MDGVSSAINRDFALLGANILFARLAEPVVHDVVFDLRIHRPAIDTDVAVLGVTGLGVLVIGSVLHANDTLTRAIVAVAETHAGQIVVVVVPLGFESTVVVVLHGVGSTRGPLFITPACSADGTRRVAVHAVGIATSLGHFVITGIDCVDRGNETESQKGSSLKKICFKHKYAPG